MFRGDFERMQACGVPDESGGVNTLEAARLEAPPKRKRPESVRTLAVDPHDLQRAEDRGEISLGLPEPSDE